MALLLFALLACAAAAPVAGARTMWYSYPGIEGGPVLSSDGRVLIGERTAGGGRRIVAFGLHDPTFSTVATFPPPADPQTFYVLKLSGGGGAVTATLDLFHSVTDTTAEQATPSLMASRAFVVLPAFAPLATCDPVRMDFPAPVQAAAGEGFLALAADDCRNSAAVHLTTPSRSFTIAAQAGSGPTPPDIADLRAAGPFATWIEHRLDSDGPKASLLAVRGATGEVLLRAPVPGRYGLGSDGTIALAERGTCVLRLVSLAPLAQRTTQLPAGLCPGFFGEVAVAGGLVVYPVLGSYAVADVQGAAHTVSELPVDPIRSTPLAFDGRTLLGVRHDCDGDRLLAVDATVAGGGPLPLVPPPSSQACPVRRAGPSRLRIAPDGRVRIRVYCSAGCRGTLRLVEQRRGGRERLIGRADYVLAPGARRIVPVRIAHYARALAGCRGGLRAVAQVRRPGDRAKGLGAYRIVSSSRCRRTGGPAFKASPLRPRR